MVVGLLTGCTASKKLAITSNTQVHFVDEYTVPHKKQFKGTIIGGLSGIDYDAEKNLYYLICDDGSKINPARFYTATIAINDKGIDSVEFIDVTALLKPNGNVYSNASVDPEAMRFQPRTKELYWSSEGERTLKSEGAVLVDPFVRVASTNGKYKDSFALPSNMHMQKSEHGPRNNGTFEGLAFDKDYKSLYVSVEEPLYEDGPRAATNDSTAWVRILKFDAVSKKPVAQYAYQIDAVAHEPIPASAFKINGISDILWLGENKLLVVERSFSTGISSNTIKLYVADLVRATDVSNIVSLQNNLTIQPVTKNLLLNMDSLGMTIDNVEGVTFGPRFSNGHQSLIFITDDNFSATQKTQFLLFEIR